MHATNDGEDKTVSCGGVGFRRGFIVSRLLQSYMYFCGGDAER